MPRPTAPAAGFAVGKATDPAEKGRQQLRFAKNLSVLGGLILEAMDTEVAPSLGWRARRAARKARDRVVEVRPGG